MKRWFLGLGSFALAVVSCKPLVLDVVDPDVGPSSGPVVAGSGSSGSGEGPLSFALAMRGADAPIVGERVPEPEALVLVLDSQPVSCQAPFAFPPACDGTDQLRLAISIPPELNRPGVIALDDFRIGFSEVAMSADCSGGWGSGNSYSGTLEIVSSDASSVQVKLRGTLLTPDQNYDGDYTATFCGAPPVTPPPTPFAAMKGSSVSGDPSSGTGPTADPDALYLFFGTAPASCAEPVPTVDCTVFGQVVLSLPPALQHPGEIDLADPAIDAIFTAPVNSCATAAFHSGKLRITSIDATSLAIELFESQAGLDGAYAGTICP